MVFQNGVKCIQAAAYNGTRMVDLLKPIAADRKYHNSHITDCKIDVNKSTYFVSNLELGFSKLEYC